jgi:PmbA protein
MNTELHKICSDVLDKCLKYGAEDGKVDINSTRSVEVNYRDRKPDTIKEASSRRLSVNLLVDGRFSAQSTPDLRPESLSGWIKQAIENTRFLEPDAFRTLPDEKYYGKMPESDFKLADPSFSDVSPEMRHDLVKEIEASCLDAGGNKVISVEAGTRDNYYEEVSMNSNGFEGYNKNTITRAGAMMTAKDEGDRRPNGYYWVGARMRNDLPDSKVIGKEAAKRTLDLLGGKKIPTETSNIIIQNDVAGRVLYGLLSAMYGYNIQQKQSFLIDKKGTQIGSRHFTLVDDPLLVGGFGTRFYDGDGMKSLKRTMINEGILESYYIDWYYSRKLECEPTTGYPSNLIIPPGNRSVKEIMRDLGRGILITGFIGGNSNPTTGDTSIGIIGFLFDNGELEQPIAEMNIADNHLTFWNKLVEIGNDPWPYSSWKLPSLVFEDVVVSGV